MKKYRLGYDYLFIAKKPFNYKGDFIGAMSINVLFKVFDELDNEVLFESNELEDQRLYFKNGNSCFLNDFYNCFIDKKNIFVLASNRPLTEESGYKFSFEIDSYTKDINSDFVLEPEFITRDEFIDIIKNNIDFFDISTNNPAQSTCYFANELKENEIPKILGIKYLVVKPKERYVLEIVTKVEPIFRYKSCEPILIDDNILSIEVARKLVNSMKDSLRGKQFFLLTKYENERKIFWGKMHI